MATPVTITSIDFHNYRAFGRFSVSLDHLNVLAGPNNNGKSTVLSALRLLAIGIRKARSKAAEWVETREGFRHGHRLSAISLPDPSGAVHTDLAEVETLLIFRLSNGNKITLVFQSESHPDCLMFAEAGGKDCVRPRNFKEQFPITIRIVPHLSPIDPHENLVSEETVRVSMLNHLAPRHFRGYWFYQNEDAFEAFRKLQQQSWPGMEIQRPKKLEANSEAIGMFAQEKIGGVWRRRELGWCGSGFQIWCQLLTHLIDAAEDTMLVVDEPEIYLHPDVQLQLIELLRQLGPDVIIATHSSDIMSVVDPSEILYIDKSERAAKRLKDVEAVQRVLNLVGSLQNITLTKLARDRRVLFVENTADFAIIKRLAAHAGFPDLSSGLGLTAEKSEGFSTWEVTIQVRCIALGKSSARSAVPSRRVKHDDLA